MDKKSIKRYAASGLAAMLLAGTGLAIHDTNAEEIIKTDSKVQFEPVITELEYQSSNIVNAKEKDESEKNFYEKCLSNLHIYYGFYEEMLTQTYKADPIEEKDENGNVVGYSGPVNYVFATDENGKLTCLKDVSTFSNGYGYLIQWGNSKDAKLLKLERKQK